METEPKKKGRGRPPKAIKDGEATPKKSKATKRGRPKTDEGEYFIITYLIWLIGQTSAHYWYRYMSFLRLIIQFGFLVPYKQIIRRK